ncbi:hypothetical protein Patl1_37049 [Pistacia atlantica]|nr:hypothetical protein Patl1_37049 [Pistacia atlantica]
MIPQPQKLQNNAKAKPVIKDPSEKVSIEEVETPGDGAGACSFSPAFVAGEAAAAPLGDSPAIILLTKHLTDSSPIYPLN